MARTCDICGKGGQAGHNVSRSNRRTKRRWNVNLHRVRALINGHSKRIRVCNTCLKSGRVLKAG